MCTESCDEFDLTLLVLTGIDLVFHSGCIALPKYLELHTASLKCRYGDVVPGAAFHRAILSSQVLLSNPRILLPPWTSHKIHCNTLRIAATPRPMANQAPPVLLFDIMVRTLYWAPRCSRCTPAPQDTVVVDPFYKHMAPFFGLTFQELLDAKHPTAWLEFERGQVDEAQFAAMFFKDGRHVDAPVLRAAMTDAYDFVPGMETLLQELVDGGHQLHACSNYTEWYRAIEGKLLLSRFLNWTFMSCEGPMKVQATRQPCTVLYVPCGNRVFAWVELMLTLQH